MDPPSLVRTVSRVQSGKKREHLLICGGGKCVFFRRLLPCEENYSRFFFLRPCNQRALTPRRFTNTNERKNKKMRRKMFFLLLREWQVGIFLALTFISIFPSSLSLSFPIGCDDTFFSVWPLRNSQQREIPSIRGKQGDWKKILFLKRPFFV